MSIFLGIENFIFPNMIKCKKKRKNLIFAMLLEW